MSKHPRWKDGWTWPWQSTRSHVHSTTRAMAGLRRMADRLERGKVWLWREDRPSVEVDKAY